MRGSAGLVPWLDLDQHDDVPLYLQLYEQVRRAVLSGRLGPGARLPSSRTLASELGLSRATVIQAYDRSGPRDTWRRRSAPAPASPRPFPRSGSPLPHRPAGHPRAVPPSGCSGRRSPWPPRSAGAGQLDVARPFLPGYPALDLFPIAVWRRLAWRRLRSRNQVDLLRPPEPAGHPALRAAIAEHLRLTRGVRCTADQVVITTGTQQALARLAALLLDPGDAAWIEDPGYLGARRALSRRRRAARARAGR